MIRVLNQYVSTKSLLLVVLEGGFLVFGLICGVRLRFWGDPAEFDSYLHAPGFAFQAAVFVVTLQACFYYTNLYDLNTVRNRRDQLICLGQSLGSASLLLGLTYFIFPALLIGRGVFFISTAFVAAFVLTTRTALDAVWPVAARKQNILILGSQGMALVVARELMRRGDLNVELLGFLEPDRATASREDAVLLGCPILGTMDELESVVRDRQISRIIVALENRRGSLPIRELVRLRVLGVIVEDAHSTVSSLTGRIWLDMVQPSWFIYSGGFRRARPLLVLKRAGDLALGILGLLLSSPIMLAVALAVWFDSGRPVIFSQTRVGLKGRCFKVLKFRSMRVDAEADKGAQWAQENDQRVTRVGRYLRKYRLDELPQFINVIRGEMSFVGPRPERPVFVDQLRKAVPYYDERHSVRPGLTGWAQVEYSYGASVEDSLRKLEYDLFYLKDMSAFFDCLIILKTIRIFFSGRGGR